MSAGEAAPAGSSRCLRLDPLSLPVRFRTADATADERVRIVELHREIVVLRRSVLSMRIKVSLPITAFLGIVLRLVPPDRAEPGVIAVMLEHCDRALSIPLFAASNANEVLAEWRMWARIFGLPLFVADHEGRLREPFHRRAIGIFDPCERARRSKPRRPRPSILVRRRAGHLDAPVTMYREREIIARS